jgi:aspartate/glutamate racemase
MKRSIKAFFFEKKWKFYRATFCVGLLVQSLNAHALNQQKDITIVGGAGPQAGIMLADMITKTCQLKWGCQNDEDFPYIQLLSFPFSDMLSSSYSNEVACELKQLIEHELTEEKTKSWVIACNTLHIYADLLQTGSNFYHIMEVTKPFIKDETALILCTSASLKSRIHAKYLNSFYPNLDDQEEIDQIITTILSGKITHEETKKLENICLKYPKLIPVLGCTELSVLQAKYPLSIKIIDPCEILSEKLATDWYLAKTKTFKALD